MTDPSDLSMSWMVQESLDCFYASITIAIMPGIRSRWRPRRFNVDFAYILIYKKNKYFQLKIIIVICNYDKLYDYFRYY